jgi:hypothetical protein
MVTNKPPPKLVNYGIELGTSTVSRMTVYCIYLKGQIVDILYHGRSWHSFFSKSPSVFFLSKTRKIDSISDLIGCLSFMGNVFMKLSSLRVYFYLERVNNYICS